MLPSHSNFWWQGLPWGHILKFNGSDSICLRLKNIPEKFVLRPNKVDFLNPIEVGELITLKASVKLYRANLYWSLVSVLNPKI